MAGGTGVAATIGIGAGGGTAGALAYTGAPDVLIVGMAGFMCLVLGLTVRGLVRRHNRAYQQWRLRWK